MILAFIKTYLSLIISLLAPSIFMIAGGIYLIFKPSKLAAASPNIAKPVLAQAVPEVTRPKKLTAKQLLQDLTAIAGEDILLTQLDLAQAYIDSGKKDLARNILQNVLAQGSALYQQEARQLLNCI